MCLFTQWAVGRPAVLFSQYCVGSQQRGTRTIVNTGAVPSVRIRPTDGRTPMSRAHTRLSCVTTLSTGSAARLGTHTHTHTQRVSPSAPGPGPTLRPCGPTHDQRHCVLALNTHAHKKYRVQCVRSWRERLTPMPPASLSLSLSLTKRTTICRQPCNHAAMMGSASWSGLFGPKSCFRTFRRNLLFFPNLPTFSSIG